MNRLLNALGLMTRAEHERLLSEQDNRDYKAWSKVADERDDMKMSRDDMAHKYKKAITDLAAARDEVEELRAARVKDAEFIRSLENTRNGWIERAGNLEKKFASYEADALAMRRKRQMDRDRKKGKVA